MNSIICLAVLIFTLSLRVAAAQDAAHTADHDALRKLKDDVIGAINSRDLARMDSILHEPFLSTVNTQDSFDDSAKMRAWFEGLFSRSLLRLNKIQMNAEADELSHIYTGTFVVARGSTKERYERADVNCEIVGWAKARMP